VSKPAVNDAITFGEELQPTPRKRQQVRTQSHKRWSGGDSCATIVATRQGYADSGVGRYGGRSVSRVGLIKAKIKSVHVATVERELVRVWAGPFILAHTHRADIMHRPWLSSSHSAGPNLLWRADPRDGWAAVYVARWAEMTLVSLGSSRCDLNHALDSAGRPLLRRSRR